MYKNGPVIIIEDDDDDQQLFKEIFSQLGYPNELLFFGDGDQALDYLNNFAEKPFLIISDINLPRLNGMELRKKIHNNKELSLKCIPYLFLTTSASHQMVVDAYSNSIQGFFVKPTSYRGLQRIIENIMNYWQDCKAPFSQLVQ